MDAAPNLNPVSVTSFSPRDLWRNLWMRHALILWGVLGIATAVKCFVQPWQHSVFPNFYFATLRWWHNESIYVYTGYQYTPTFAVANTPFAWFGMSGGAALFSAFSIALMVAAVFTLARSVAPGRWLLTGVAALLTLTLLGAMRGIWSSQSNAIVISLVIFAAAAIVRNRWWTATFLLATPVFIKLWPLALVMLLVACWPRPLWWRFPLACLALAAVPFFTRWPETVAYQHHQYWIALSNLEHIRSGGYRDAWTILEQFVEPNRRAYLVLQLGAALTTLGFCLWRKRQAPATQHAVLSIVSAWVVWQLLFGPGSERMTYGILAPFASWAVMVSFQERRGRILSVTAWLLTGVLGSGAVERSIGEYLWGVEMLQPLGVVLFAAWLVVHAWRDSQRMEQPNVHQNVDDEPAFETRLAA